MTASVSGTTSSSADPTSSTSGLSSVQQDQNLFLSMLIAQMKNQDPTSSMDPNQMVQEMSQMTQTEQTVNMAQSMGQLQDVSMIGKLVGFTSATGTDQAGTVVGVTTKSGTSQLVVENGNETWNIDPTSVTDIADPAAATADPATPSAGS